MGLIAFGFVLYIMLFWCLWVRCMGFGDLVGCSLVGLAWLGLFDFDSD